MHVYEKSCIHCAWLMQQLLVSGNENALTTELSALCIQVLVLSGAHFWMVLGHLQGNVEHFAQDQHLLLE